ncbi:MAG: hypothetical protein M1831_002649 [Alyxoria varia]|nr:MAG: hypothetical protein M1831_002649 [Alyxoria varia]
MTHSSNPLHSQPAARDSSKPSHQVIEEIEQQWLFSEEEMNNTPSIRDGMSLEEERERRSKALNFIMQAGMMLKLPQIPLSTAALYLNRFLMRYSLVQEKGQPKVLHHYQIAALALFVATKSEENCRRMKELVIACCRVALKSPNLEVNEHDQNAKDFWKWRDTLVLNESVMMETLCFDFQVQSPHKLLYDLLRVLNVSHNKRLRSAAWSFINDSSMTILCLRYPAKVVAAAAVYAGIRFCVGTDDEVRAGLKDDHGLDWWQTHRLNVKDIRGACNIMADVYEEDPTKYDGEYGSSIYVGLRDPDFGGEDGGGSSRSGGASGAHSGLPSTQPPAQTNGDAASLPNRSSSHTQNTARESRLNHDEQCPPDKNEQADFEGPAPLGSSGTRRTSATSSVAGVKRERDGTPIVGGSRDAVRMETSQPRHVIENVKVEDDDDKEEGEVESDDASSKRRKTEHKVNGLANARTDVKKESPRMADVTDTRVQDDDGGGSEEGEVEE